MYPSFSFTPDDSAIVVWSKGHIWKVSTTTGVASIIPFSAQVSLDLSPTTRFKQQVSSNDAPNGKFSTKVVLNPSAPSDSSVVFFESVGSIYSKSMITNTSAPVVFESFTDTVLLSNPSVSFDGKFLAYVSWNDQSFATLYVSSTAQSHISYAVPETPGRIVRPAFSPRNDRLAYIRLAGDTLSGGSYFRGAGVYWRTIDLAATPPTFGPAQGPFSGRQVTFSKDSRYAHVLDGDYPRSTLSRFDVVSFARTLIAVGSYASSISISPDESYIAFVEFRSVYVAKFSMIDNAPMNVTSLGVSRGLVNPAVRKVWSLGADYLTWSDDGKKLRFGWGGDFYEVQAVSLMNCASDNVICISSTIKTYSVSVVLPADIAPTYVVFDNVTIISMDDELGIVKNGRLTVKDGRIQDVGSSQQVPIPSDAQVRDMSGSCSSSIFLYFPVHL